MPSGSKGLSLFIAPKSLPDGSRNDISVAGLNHKLGFRGTPNCLLNFGERDGAVAWRVGEGGQGLSQMFMMMNEARISVGMGAAAIAYRGYRHSVRYAMERLQGRQAGTSGGDPVPIVMHADVRRMLLQQKAYAEGGLAICLYCADLIDKADEDAEALLAVLTPVAKSWPSEFGLAANDLAIQVHGGYGYTRDFDVELLWRDNRLNPIHEGTTGIQGIDLLGRKLLRSDGAGMKALLRRVSATVEKTPPGGLLASRGQTLIATWKEVSDLIEALRGRDPARSLDDATMFLRGFGHAVIAWLWLDMAVAAVDHADADLAQGVEFACRFFFEEELPIARAWLNVLGTPRDAFAAVPSSAFL
jgi:hypothetical protein